MAIKNCYLFDRCNHKDCTSDFCERKYRMDSLYSSALLSETQKQRITLHTDNGNDNDIRNFRFLAEIERTIDKFILEGKNLYIHSAICGNGKSSWAIRLLQAFFEKIWARTDLSAPRALFISVPRLLLALKENISERSEYVAYIKENISKADIVVWDDIAAKVGSEFELNHLLAMIEERLALGKSNIYTSNLDKEGLKFALGDRLASRVASMSLDIEFTGSDKRFLRVED